MNLARWTSTYRLEILRVQICLDRLLFSPQISVEKNQSVHAFLPQYPNFASSYAWNVECASGVPNGRVGVDLRGAKSEFQNNSTKFVIPTKLA